MADLKKLEVDLPSPGLISPLRSSKPHFTEDSPTFEAASEKISPQSFRAKPWPERPQQLYKGNGGYRHLESVTDAVFLFLSVPFFLLAFAVIAVNGRQVNEHQLNRLQEAIKGATTIFPICFAAIVGRAAVKYATWKLEQGTTIGVLEQLMGSRTVASAIITQIQLRSFNIVGLVLLFIWCLSPLGSQSVLHILFTPTKPVEELSYITYFNSRQQSYSAPIGSFHNQWYPVFTVLMGGTLVSPSNTKNTTMDMWGNVRIPFFPGNLSEPSREWTDIPNDDPITFSSLFGLPMSNIGLGNTTVNIQSSYMHLRCTNFTNATQQDAEDGNRLLKNDLISTNGPFVSSQNATLQTPWAMGYQGPDLADFGSATNQSNYVLPQSCPDCLPASYMDMSFDSGTLLFQEYDGDFGIISIYCTPSQVYVESQVSCEVTSASQDCAVTAQRPSQLPHMPSEITYLSFPQVVLGLTSLLPNSTTTSGSSDPIQGYLYNPHSISNITSSLLSVFEQPGDVSPLFNVSLPDFGDRLSQIINTFILASTWNFTSILTAASVLDVQALETGGNAPSFSPATTSQELDAMIANQTAAFTVPATLTNNILVYAAFYPWLVVFLFSNSVMLAAAVVSIWFARRTIVPDYLGFVSSLAKESPYMAMPDVGVNMDGMDKARMVREVKVRLGDVSGNVEEAPGAVGKLAFARLGDTRKVKKGMLYI